MHQTNTNMKLKLNQSEFTVAKQLAGNSDLHFALSNGCVLLVIRVGWAAVSAACAAMSAKVLISQSSHNTLSGWQRCLRCHVSKCPNVTIISLHVIYDTRDYKRQSSVLMYRVEYVCEWVSVFVTYNTSLHSIPTIQYTLWIGMIYNTSLHSVPTIQYTLWIGMIYNTSLHSIPTYNTHYELEWSITHPYTQSPQYNTHYELEWSQECISVWFIRINCMFRNCSLTKVSNR